MSLFELMKRQFHRECLVHVRQKKAWMYALVFFAIFLVFFPLTLPADPILERTIAPGVVWIAMLLSNLVSAERLFQTDYEEGVIEQWLVSNQSLSALVLAKIAVHWGLNLILMLLFCPVIALLFGLDYYELLFLMLSLVCGTPTVAVLCALSSAYSTSIQQKGALMGLILLPLAIPIMILGAATVSAAMNGLPVSGYLAFLLSISCFAVVGLPFATAAVIRSSMAG